MRVNSFSVCHLIHVLRTKKLTSWSSIPTGGGFISAHALTKLVKTVGGIAETHNLQNFTTIIYRYQYITNLPTCYKIVMVTSILKNTRQAISLLCNNEVCSCNHCFNGQEISITYSESVFLALDIQHAMHKCHIVMGGLPNSTVFFHIIS
jgi:uncharacterized membrane protein